MLYSYVVNYACSSKSKFLSDVANKMQEKFDIKIEATPSVNDLFKLISNYTSHIDLLIIEIELLQEVSSSSVSNLINTISTLIDCSSINSTTKIAIACDTHTDPRIIKEILNANIVGIYPCGPGFTFEEKSIAMIELLNGVFYIPTPIKSIIESPKKCSACKEHGINLTPRESQIISLIRDRGVSNKVIAKMLKITESTVKLHVTNILKKYGVKNRTQLAVFSRDTTEV